MKLIYKECEVSLYIHWDVNEDWGLLILWHQKFISFKIYYLSKYSNNVDYSKLLKYSKMNFHVICNFTR